MTAVDPTFATQIEPFYTSGDSAFAILRETLDRYGLGSLADVIWNWRKEGRPDEQIRLDLRQTPEYQARFPALTDLRNKGRAISEDQYIDLERTYTQSLRAAGLPQGFYDSPDDFANLIRNEVSPAEFNDRVKSYETLAFQMPR